MKTLIDLVTAAPPKVLWTAAAILAILAMLAFWAARKAYRALGKRPIEDVLTAAAASIATGVSAQGMWRFAGDVLGLDGPLRLLLFAFIEVAIVTSAVRARRNMRASAESAKVNTWETPTAGADGIAVWVLTVLTAILSSMDARSLAEAVFRLAAPLVAAWLWERGMAVERKRITGLAGINWAITPERVLVRIGLAEAKGRATTEVDAHQKLTRVALAAKRVHQLQEANASKRKLAAAIVKRDRALDQAVEHTGLAADEVMQMALLDLVTTLGGGDSLTAILGTSAAPWSRLDHPAVTGAVRNSEIVELSAETRRLADAVLSGRDRVGDPDATGRATSAEPVFPDEALPPPSPEGRSWMASLLARTRPLPRPDAPLPTDLLDPPASVATPDAEPDAEADAIEEADATDPRPDADLDDDQKEPTEQDKRRVAKWWVKRVKAGEVLGKYKLAERTGFKTTWCGNRIVEGKKILADEGWTFDENGTPIPPEIAARPAAEPDATAPSVNGSEPSTSN